MARGRSVARLTTLVLGGMLIGCSRSPSTGQPGPTDVELQVAATALSDFVGEPDSLGELRLVKSLQARTAAFPDSAAWTAAIGDLVPSRDRHPTLIASYWRANRHARPLPDTLRVPGWRVRLVDIPTNDPQHVGTVYYVSRVGFTPDRDSALVAVDGLCGQLCGRGVLVLYVRTLGAWRLASTLQSLQY
ncbi:MAG: hypothetical protein OEW06_10100 [Gemmatimonadota bacterium]|nr:hypothetical protein [Gemmatimonadota bacterium]